MSPCSLRRRTPKDRRPKPDFARSCVAKPLRLALHHNHEPSLKSDQSARLVSDSHAESHVRPILAPPICRARGSRSIRGGVWQPRASRRHESRFGAAKLIPISGKAFVRHIHDTRASADALFLRPSGSALWGRPSPARAAVRFLAPARRCAHPSRRAPPRRPPPRNAEVCVAGNWNPTPRP